MSSALIAAVGRYIETKGGGEGLFTTGTAGFDIFRTTKETPPLPMVYKPALCLVVQGAKQLMLGDDVFDYRAMQSLVVSVEIPAFGRVTRASPLEPYLGMTIEFDVGVMREVMEQLDKLPRPRGETGPGVFVADVGDDLADCILRLTCMLTTPKAIPVLYPSIMREICFWLLTGPHGNEVCRLALPDSHTQRVAEAIHLLRENYVRPIRVDQLAAAARMSPSSFHQHFKTLTSMSPLQYQKQLRLLEARRLMVADAVNVTSAAYRVGYESPSQFSREYARMFGTPPRRDVTELRAVSA